MSHPTNRRERFLVGQHKGEKRALGLYSYQERLKRPEGFQLGAQRLRDTTKLCGGPCCANPRHSGWEKSGSRFTMQERKFEEGFKKDY
jgi:hypothetical protein